MDFLLINKNKQINIREEYSSSFETFLKRERKEKKIIENKNFYLSVYDGLNAKCYLKEFENGDFIVTLGTLFYKDKFGDDCLQPLINDFKEGKRNLYNDLMGSYSVLIYINEKLYTFNDFLGLMRVYCSSDNMVFSTSFLAIAKSLKTKTPSTQEIYEYIIRGGMYGDKTILKEICLIPRSKAICINGDCKDEKLEYTYKRLPFYNDYDKMLEYVSDEYIKTFEVIKSNFNSKITTALSGGYDTRLMLALFKKNKMQPDLYVYGNKNSLDVKVAKRIAEGEKIDLEHIDRSIFAKVTSDNYGEVVSDNFYYFDGLNTGGIFDDGVDVISRKMRSSEDLLQINGAGGEIWRNFWQLNSRKKKSFDFVRHKWDIYNYDAFSNNFDKDKFFESFSEKVNDSIGKHQDNSLLSRKEIEMSYPLFRYRYFQSIGNSINLGFQHTIMPLMETKFLYPSFDLPIHHKYNGKFEAELITKIDKKIASYESDRGFNFSDKIPLKFRVKGYIMRNIPLQIKPYLRYNYSIKPKENIPYYLKEDYISKIIDIFDLFISRYLDIKKIKNSSTLSRALTLEYFFKNI